MLELVLELECEMLELVLELEYEMLELVLELEYEILELVLELELGLEPLTLLELGLLPPRSCLYSLPPRRLLLCAALLSAL